jgi:hypothetical protein
MGSSFPRGIAFPGFPFLTYETVRLGLIAGDTQAQVSPHPTDSPSAPVNVTVRHLKANSAVVSWDVLEDEVVIGFAISQQVTNS